MSIRTTKHFLDAHAALRDRVEHLPVVARELPELGEEERFELIERTAAFLAEMLLPHAAAEEHILYPEAARLLGSADDSEAVAGDRVAVRELLVRLAVVDASNPGAVQEIVWALYVLLASHVWREESVYLRLVREAPESEVTTLLDTVTQRGVPRGGRFARRPSVPA